jgi:hypothetical protein
MQLHVKLPLLVVGLLKIYWKNNFLIEEMDTPEILNAPQKTRCGFWLGDTEAIQLVNLYISNKQLF